MLYWIHFDINRCSENYELQNYNEEQLNIYQVETHNTYS